MNLLFNGNINELSEIISIIPASKELLEFANETTLPALVKKLTNGCPLLTSQYTALPASPVDIVAPSYSLANEGLFFDVATFLNGEPECWFNEEYSNELKPAKDFYINVAAGYKVTTNTIFDKLLKIVQIIDSLEGNGQRLNIFVCVYSKTDNNGKVGLICKVKDSSEPVNIAQLIYLCASPAILRYCFLNILENKFGSDDGAATDTKEDELQLMNKENIYIPCFTYDKIILGINNYTTTDLQKSYKF